MANGQSIDECAQSMGVSRNMVNRHLERARNKLNASSTTEAVYRAAKIGLIVWTFIALPLIASFAYSSLSTGYFGTQQMAVMDYRRSRRNRRGKTGRKSREQLTDSDANNCHYDTDDCCDFTSVYRA